MVKQGWQPGFSCDVKHQDRWHGTVCAGGTVLRLELMDNGLRGTLPTELGLLPDLTTLVVESNPSLSGTVPTEIGALARLNSLSISNNTLISGTIPQQLTLLTSLRFLSLHSASLSGTLPATPPTYLSKIMYLNAASNRLGGHMLPAHHMNAASFVSVHTNVLSGTIATQIGLLTSLKDRLYAQSNRLSGTLPSELGNLNQAPLPALHENSISGLIPTELAHVTQLAFPSLSYNQLTGTTPTELKQNWISLDARLDLASNRLSDAGAQATIDANIISRGLSDSTPRLWYTPWERCDLRAETMGRFQCSSSVV